MTPPPTDPTAVFAELGRIRLGETDLDGVLTRVAELAKKALPGAGEVSVTLVGGGDARTAACTGEPALQLDELQYALGRGPCLEAAASRQTLHVSDMAAESRWPRRERAARCRSDCRSRSG